MLFGKEAIASFTAKPMRAAERERKKFPISILDPVVAEIFLPPL